MRVFSKTNLALFALGAIIAIVVAQVRLKGNTPGGVVQTFQPVEQPEYSQPKRFVSVDNYPVEIDIQPSQVEPKAHTIKFENGRTVDVLLQHRHPFRPYLQRTERLLEIYYELEEAALAGNTRAAVQLALDLKDCRTALPSQAAVDAELARAQREGTLTHIDFDGSVKLVPMPSDYDLSSYAKPLRDMVLHCEGVTEEQHRDVEKWLRLAVAGGDYYGTRHLVDELGFFSQESFELWNQAWYDGEVAATRMLRIYFRRGFPDAESGQPDYKRAYAYYLIATKVHAAADQYARQSIPFVLNGMQTIVDDLGQHLSPHEQSEAVNLAADLLEENTLCCIGTWRW